MRVNYKGNKMRKEAARKQEQEEKRLKRLRRKNENQPALPSEGTPPAKGTTSAVILKPQLNPIPEPGLQNWFENRVRCSISRHDRGVLALVVLRRRDAVFR
jgi:hypothetical protein